MFDLVAIQDSLKEFGLDGWLFYDFRGANVLARRVLGLDQKPVGSRRFFYFVPASGQPRKLVHRIETAALDGLPGEKAIYLRWQDLEAGVATLAARQSREWRWSTRLGSPTPMSRASTPARSSWFAACGVDVVSSGDLIQRFEATWDDDQWQMHKDAEKVTCSAYEVALGPDPAASASGRHDSRDRGSIGHHGPLSSPRPDHLQPADRRRRASQRRPALRAGRRQGRGRSGEMTWCSSISGPSSTDRGRFTAT